MIPEKIRENPWIQLLVVLASITLLLVFLIWIRNILLPFFLAFIIAYILDPVVDWIENKLHLHRTVAIVLIIFMFTIILFFGGYYLVENLIRFGQHLQEMAQDPPDIIKWLRILLPEKIVDSLISSFEQLDPQQLWENSLSLIRTNLSQVTNTLQRGSTYLWLFASRTFGAIGFLVNAGIFVIVTIYLLRDFDKLLQTTGELIPPQHREAVESFFREIDTVLRAFFRGQLIVCISMGAGYSIGLLILGITGGVAIGISSGLLNIIPYLGPTFGFILALGVGLYQYGISFWILIGVPAVYTLVQFIEGSFLTPNIVGKQVGLNPVVVIFALMVFAKIMGFVGFLIAIPLAAIIKVMFKRLLLLYKQSELYQPESY